MADIQSPLLQQSSTASPPHSPPRSPPHSDQPIHASSISPETPAVAADPPAPAAASSSASSEQEDGSECSNKHMSLTATSLLPPPATQTEHLSSNHVSATPADASPCPDMPVPSEEPAEPVVKNGDDNNTILPLGDQKPDVDQDHSLPSQDTLSSNVPAPAPSSPSPPAVVAEPAATAAVPEVAAEPAVTLPSVSTSDCLTTTSAESSPIINTITTTATTATAAIDKSTASSSSECPVVSENAASSATTTASSIIDTTTSSTSGSSISSSPLIVSPLVQTPVLTCAPIAPAAAAVVSVTTPAMLTPVTTSSISTCVPVLFTTSTTSSSSSSTASVSSVSSSTITSSPVVVPVTTAKRVILTAHTQSVLNAPIRASSLFPSNINSSSSTGSSSGPTAAPSVTSASSSSPTIKSQLQPMSTPMLITSLPNGNVTGMANQSAVPLSVNAGIRSSSPLVTTPTVIPLVTRSNIVTGNSSAITSLTNPALVAQSGNPPAALVTSNGPVVTPSPIKQLQQQPASMITTPATSGPLSNHQSVPGNSSAVNKIVLPQTQTQPSVQMPVPAAGQSTVIISTPDGPKAVVVNQSLVPGSPAATRVLPVNCGSGNVMSSPVLLTGSAAANKAAAGTATVQSNQLQQQQQNMTTVRTPIPQQVLTQQQHQVQQQQQQPLHPQQQQVVVNPQQMQQTVHMIRTPSGQMMQLTPAQQQQLQRQLAPRPLIFTGNGPIRLQQSPVRPGQQSVNPQGAVTFRPGGHNCVLVRTEHGLQLINIAPQQGIPTGQQQIRFTTPIGNAAPGQMPQQMAQVRQQILNIGTQPQIRTAMPQQQQQQQQPQQVHQQAVQLNQSAPVPSMAQPLTIQTSAPAANQAAGSSAAATANAQSQMSPNTAKRKCKNFLSTLIRLATDQPEHVAQNVRKLIQGLIDGNIIPEDFTNQLQRELNSSPQPCLIPFLKKSLPHLKQSLMLGELTIEGVNPPPRTALPQPQLPLQFQRPAGIRFVTTSSSLTFPPGAIIQTQQQQRPQMTTPMQSGVSNQHQQQQLQQNQSVAPPPAPSPQTSATAAATTTTTTPAPKSKSKAKSRASSAATKEKQESKKISSALREDDDINDVAAMGGVNLAEENQRMAAAANEVGTQIRSCKDETFFLTNTLANKITRITQKFGLDDPSNEVISLISHAAQERIKTLVERLGIIAEHRLEVFKVDPKYEVCQDVRSQVKFLEELDKMEKRRHEEQEREMLLKAAKSRSKLEDPEQLKLKQKAKEMQRAEMEEARQREANETALLAIGPRKKMKLDNNSGATPSSSTSLLSTATVTAGGSSSVSPGDSSMSGAAGAASSNFNSPFSNNNNSGTPSNHFTSSSYGTPFSSSKGPMRRMTKRVYMKDLLFLMEQDRSTCKSAFLYKSYNK